MIDVGRDCIWRMVAFVDLPSNSRDLVVENALSLAATLQADVTLLSVVPRRAYERGVRYEWPRSAFGKTYPQVDIHRVVLPGDPATALALYAERIRAHVLVVPAEYNTRGWFRKQPLASSVAVLSARILWIAPSATAMWNPDARPRIGCVVRLDGTDDRVCTAAMSLLRRWGGEIVLAYATRIGPARARPGSLPMDRQAVCQAMERIGRSLPVPWSSFVVEGYSDAALLAAAVEKNVNVVVSGRPMYAKGDANAGYLFSAVTPLPCPILSVPLSDVSGPACLGSRGKL